MEHLFMLEFNAGGVPGRLITFSAEYQQPSETSYFRHRHQHFELHYVREGSCTFLADADSFVVEAGNLCLIAPDNYHSIKSTSPDLKKMCIGFELSLPPDAEADSLSAVLRPFQSFRVFTGPASRLQNTLQRILQTTMSSQPEFFAREELRCLLSLLLLELARQIGPFPPATRDSGITIDLKRNYMIDEFFNNNFHLRGGDQVLAGQLHISSRQLDRILKSLYGKSYREKLLEIRLEVSLDLLKFSDKSVAAISELTGYSNPASFCSFIKKETGHTPGEIRRLTSPEHTPGSGFC